MSRRTDKAAERAAAQASEAARTLGKRSAEVRSEPAPEPEQPDVIRPNPDRVEKLLKNRPSEMAREEIFAKREAMEPQEEPVEEAKEEPKAEAQEPAPEVPVAPVEAPEAPPVPVMVKQKVDGEEYEVSQEEIDEAGGPQAWRMAKASDNRLRKSNELLAEIRRAASEMAVKQTPPPTPVADEIKELEKKRQEFLNAFDFEGASKVQDEIYEKKLSSSRLDPQQLIQQAAAYISNQQAVTKFRQDYPELVADPMLYQWTLAVEKQRMGELKGAIDWHDFYSKLGNDLRSRLGRPSQPATTSQTTGTPSQPSEKEARKASITTLPTASARAALPAEAKELSPDEERKAWIAEQKKARGLG